MTKLHTVEQVHKEGMSEVVRLKVPNGWLYITHHYGIRGVASSFVAESQPKEIESIVVKQ